MKENKTVQIEINLDEEKVDDIVKELKKYKGLDAIIVEGSDYYDGDQYYIEYKREETDEEYKERTQRIENIEKKKKEKAERTKETIKKREITMYNKLKEKYGNL